MGDAVKRSYRSPARAAAAAETRAAIRAAGAELFLEEGFSRTTMKAVAARAGVGERTLYDAFATKNRLFEHIVSVAIAGDEEPIAVADRPEFLAALAQQDGRRAVSQYATYSAAILERAAPLITVAIESAGADPALRKFSDAGAAATRANTLAFVEALARHRHVDGKPAERAMAAYALLVPLVHQHLRRDVGWSARRYRAWLEESLVRVLL
ncbi:MULTISPECIES: TetR/AcrR family transcriptional regulator [Nocardioides]|uniref:TetR/AcrR family transcriptional regulator n=1 Tax=Nocardioides vastitatis TaxID=2568655 RepID=A0ABW0ZEV5_9ACTN|nr:helix-turn-helix domain-containing protein [Nocardioides sp.]